MRPSTKSLSPFLTYRSTMSASCELFEFHTTHRCHSVFSCFAPLASFHDRLVAREKFATRLPPVADRTSGSLPRFPISCTLFKLRLTLPPGEKFLALASVYRNWFKCVQPNYFVAMLFVSLRTTHLSGGSSVRRRINASS